MKFGSDVPLAMFFLQFHYIAIGPNSLSLKDFFLIWFGIHQTDKYRDTGSGLVAVVVIVLVVLVLVLNVVLVLLIVVVVLLLKMVAMLVPGGPSLPVKASCGVVDDPGL